MSEVNPFPEETLNPNWQMLEDIDLQLEMLERHRLYLLELKEHYENSGRLFTDVPPPPSAG